MDTPYFVKHFVTCIPGCESEVDCAGCPCHDHTDTCWPGKPDPACLCQQDDLFEEEDDDDLEE